MTAQGNDLATAPAPADQIAPTRQVIAVGFGVAAILSLSVAAQTYLSMLGHGHSFRRILLWQFASWIFWAFAAPSVLRVGAKTAERRRITAADLGRLAMLGAGVLAVHAPICAQLTLWIQPYLPLRADGFLRTVLDEAPTVFLVDLLAYSTLLVGGYAIATHRRAQRIELRESRLEADLARAQLHALRLEIEPHFLFNTLNAIAALIRQKDNARALDMLVDLGGFMRATLDHPRMQFASLASELEWVKRYVALQQTRFGDRLEVAYDIDEACERIAVPTLLLQPLVENAMRHGAAKQAQRCRITVHAAIDHRRLTLRVVDDGAGVRSDFQLALHAGTGLRNIQSRLDQLYGAAATLTVRRGEAAGTVVEVAIPATTAAWEGRATA